MRRPAALSLLLLAMLAPPVHAAWAPNGIPVAPDFQHQTEPQVIPDGTGGVIVVWADRRSGDADIWAQRLSRTGAPMWAAAGVPVAINPGDQVRPQLDGDGAGGAWVAWDDQWIVPNVRPGPGIGVQRLLATGGFDPRWDAFLATTPTGRTLYFPPNHPVPVSVLAFPGYNHGLGIGTWVRYGGQSDAWLVLTPEPDADGSLIYRHTNLSHDDHVAGPPAMATDGQGGAILAWGDERPGEEGVYADRVREDGVGLWGPDRGGRISTRRPALTPVRMIDDGHGGAIVTWSDGDLWAQHVDSLGATRWGADGVRVCTTPGLRHFPAIVSDGHGGAIIAWEDERDGPPANIYAQRLGPDGAPAAGWPLDGLLVCGASGLQQELSIATDDAGGAFIAWQDLRQYPFDIYATHVTADGMIAAGWPADGRPIVRADGDQIHPHVAPDGAGGAYFVWEDQRASGSSPAQQVYALRLRADGTIPSSQPPVVEAGGPYTFLTGVPYHFDGAHASDPEGDALTVHWDFGDGTSADRLDAAKTYASAGHYTAILTASDGESTVSDSAQVTVEQLALARGFVTGGDRVTRLKSGRPATCIRIQPVDGSFAIHDVLPSSVRLFHQDRSLGSIPADVELDHLRDADHDGTPEFECCFDKETLRQFFAANDTRKLNHVVVVGRFGADGVFEAHLSIDVVPIVAMEGEGIEDVRGPAATFTLARAASVSLDLYDATGRRVRTVHGRWLAAGLHAITIPEVASLPQGMYFWRLGGATGCGRMAIVH